MINYYYYYFFVLVRKTLRWLNWVFQGQPPMLEHELCQAIIKQGFGQTTTSAVLEKDENLLCSGLQ